MEVQIQLCDKRENIVTTMFVEQLTESRFRMKENDTFNYQLTKGTIFETKLNREDQHEITRIVKNSEYYTRRFVLPINFNSSEYQMLGDELLSRGGFWQVDFGRYLTINIPQDFEFNIDTIIQEFDLNLSEIK